MWKMVPFQLSDVFAFEADPNARMMQHLKESFKSHGRLPNFKENANAILDINIYNIAKSRRKQISGLEKLEDNEKYAREIDRAEQAADPCTWDPSEEKDQSHRRQQDILLTRYVNGSFPTSMEDWERLQATGANQISLLEVHRKFHLLRNKKGLETQSTILLSLSENREYSYLPTIKRDQKSWIENDDFSQRWQRRCTGS